MAYVRKVDLKQLVLEKGKWCPGCERTRPAVNFNKCSDRDDGLQGYCRKCWKERYGGKPNVQAAEKTRARKERFNEQHPEATARYSHEYRARHPAEVRAQKKRARRRAKELKAELSRKERHQLKMEKERLLREEMDRKDAFYAIKQSLCGSALGQV